MVVKIILANDITGKDSYFITDGPACTLVMDGHKIDCSEFKIQGNMELVVDGTKEGSGFYSSSNTINTFGTSYQGASVTLNGGTYQNLDFSWSPSVQLNNISAIGDGDYSVKCSYVDSFSANHCHFTGTRMLFSQLTNLGLIGCTIDNKDQVYSLELQACSTATITDCVIQSEATYAAIGIYEQSFVSLSNVSVVSKVQIIYLGDNSTVTLNGGNYSVTDSGTVYVARGTMTITGGTFSFDPSEYVDSTVYHVEKDDDSGVWIVTPGGV